MILFEEKSSPFLQILLGMSSVSKICSYQCQPAGEGAQSQDFDTGHLPHPHDYDGAPLWWSSLTN